MDKNTDQQLDNEDSADDEEMNESNEQVAKRTKHDDTGNKHDDLLEPKNEYDEDNENVEDLTLDDEELLDDLDQAGPSHGGEGSSQGKLPFFHLSPIFTIASRPLLRISRHYSRFSKSIKTKYQAQHRSHEFLAHVRSTVTLMLFKKKKLFPRNFINFYTFP